MQTIALREVEDKITEFIAASPGDDPLEVLIEADGTQYPVRLTMSSRNNNRLVVTYNGAVRRSQSPDGIVFQRAKWSERLNATHLQFADPTLIGNDILSIGWGQLSKEQFGVERYIDILATLRRTLKLAPPQKTVHYGSSAGGYQALVAASIDQDSFALANNPQFDWTYYQATTAVHRVAALVFGEDTVEDVRNKYPSRCNVAAYFEKVRYIPRMRLLINMKSDSDFNIQFPKFTDAIGNSDLLDVLRHVEVGLYSDSASGHNPLSQGQTVKEINSALER